MRISSSVRLLALIILSWSVSVQVRALDIQTSQAEENCRRAQLRGIWEPQNELLGVSVTAEFNAHEGGCFRTLRIVGPDQRPSARPLYQEQMAERPIAIWPLGQRLLTVWESGSALWVTVYGVENKKIKKLLDVRPEGLPEIAFSKDGSERLIFSHYETEHTESEHSPARPVSALIYRWVGNHYAPPGSVPWSERFTE